MNFPLGYSSNSGIEVQVFFSSQEVIQGIHLRAIANVYALLPAVHDVNHTPAWTREKGSEKAADTFTVHMEVKRAKHEQSVFTIISQGKKKVVWIQNLPIPVSDLGSSVRRADVSRQHFEGGCLTSSVDTKKSKTLKKVVPVTHLKTF